MIQLKEKEGLKIVGSELSLSIKNPTVFISKDCKKNIFLCSYSFISANLFDMIPLVPTGPQIPEEIAQALRYDNLVFFCGAGISKPNGLPLFNELSKQVCENLHLSIDDTPLLKVAQDRGDYAGLLNLLESGQIPNLSIKPKILRKEVIKILNAYNKDQFEIHEALLELSALSKGGNRLVTTNFDRLFFEAGLESKFSDSAPKLIPPRKEKWKNLTFLHGVIDTDNDPEGENLILTKTDFGLAYLYDNWASRFIIQLFQDFIVLFIGYSADDPVMNYLMSAISYENKRRSKNEEFGSPSIYAFVGHEEGEEKKEDTWKSIGVEPIPYNVKNNNHSLLYETIKEWAKLKKTGLAGRRIWLKQQLEKPYQEERDKENAKAVISTLKVDEKLVKYLLNINLSSDPEQRKPVDISWFKVFAVENGLLKKLTHQTAESDHFLWKPLSSIEKNIVKWLLCHLDKKELIHYIIKQAPLKTGLISLHPEFKNMLKIQLKNIQQDANQKLDERKNLFWNIISIQKDHSKSIESFCLEILIGDLNNQYSYEKATTLLSYLQPMIGFKKSVYIEKILEPDKIYEAKLAINASHYPPEVLKNEILLSHAEDFSNLLMKAMELSKFAEINDDSSIYRPTIEGHEQNQNYYPWTYLIDLVRDSFKLAMEKDKKLAEFLLHKW